ncbi:MAG TPA: class I poly(R)-hydroxyalkanoic acid synthase [Gammaproteobacteria bacterium]
MAIKDTGAAARLPVCELMTRAETLGRESLNLLSRKLTAGANGTAAHSDPLGLGKAWCAFSTRLWSNPAALARVNMDMWQDFSAVWHNAVTRSFGGDVAPVIEPDINDRRFADGAWNDNVVFDFIKQSYLLYSRAARELVDGVDGLDEGKARKLAFATDQIIDALSPTNFAATNPAVLRETVESSGQNVLDGLSNLLSDLNRSNGSLDIAMTDMEAFEVGGNLAVTPGKVVYQNELMQLIQYAPTTEKVARRPLLVIPPWMNKFYVMDLRPGNSMVQWLVDQGQTVFMISWVNPGADLAHKDFEDYLLEGPLAALDAVEKATGEREVNAVGYCLGGILLSATLAWMAARKDERIRSASLLTTMVDFSDTGEVSLFIDQEGLAELEAKIREKGYLEGQKVFDTFRTLRANDLIWSFYINNYLMGRSPPPFDLLYWNADATNMPAAVHTWVMRNLYLENRLRRPGGVRLAGETIDVTRVTTPTYVLSASEDHIAPWRTTYETTQLFSGPVKFVLSGSGHIAGVINPPHKKKYHYWSNAKTPAEAEAWLTGARCEEGSWWPDWKRWLSRQAGGRAPARIPGNGGLGVIEDAPGGYVKARTG